jgi:[acyl-carrier-protein] S-malonyltransferase
VSTQAWAAVFSGQGAQTVGMVDWLLAEHEPARRLFAEADSVLGMPLSRIVQRGPERLLSRTDVAQPAIFCVSVALWRLLQPVVPPVAVAGHSVGEYAALVAAGSLSFGEGLRVVGRRGQLMREVAEREPGGMVAVFGIEGSELRRRCRAVAGAEGLDLAAFNDPTQIVVSGGIGALRRLERSLARAEIGFRRLPVSAAFHSSLMERVASRLEPGLRRVSWSAPRYPFVSGIDGRALRSARSLPGRLAAGIRAPVRWTRVLATLAGMGIETLVEVGPGHALLSSARRTLRGVERCGLGDREEWLSAKPALSPARARRIGCPDAAPGLPSRW